jgi:hypothetical protein
VTIKNGTILTFNTGIRLDTYPGSAHNNLVEDIRIESPWYMGILVAGDNLTVRRCQVLKVGGTQVNGSSPSIVGIYASGRNITIADNEVTEFPYSGASEMGIWLPSASGSIVERNRIYGPALAGVLASPNTNVLASDNRIVMPSAGTGIHLVGSTALYRDNLVIRTTNKYAGGTDAGNNQ